MDVSEGTIPAGSTFRRNPIPACNCDSGMDDGPHGPICGSVNPAGTCDGNPCLESPSGCYLGTCQYYRDVYEHQPDAPTRTPGCSTGTQFPPPWKDGYGHDQAHVSSGGTKRPDGMFVYSMVDNILVPEKPGDYVISWRWDWYTLHSLSLFGKAGLTCVCVCVCACAASRRLKCGTPVRT